MRKWMGTILLLAVVGMLIGLMVIPAIAQEGGRADVPKRVNYQGYLENKNTGEPVTDPVNMYFALYTESSGGTEVWSEYHTGVTPVDGLFSLELGSQGSLLRASHLDGDLYLSVTVGTDTAMNPRQRLSSVGYALRSEIANSACALDSPDGILDDVVYVDNEGDVGIGTTIPSVLLDITRQYVSTDTVEDMLEIDRGSTGTALNGIGSGILFRTQVSNGGHAPSGRISSIMEIADVSRSRAGMLFQTRSEEGEMTYALYLDPDGRAGIGTTDPSTELEVVGTVTATAFEGDGSLLTGVHDNLGNHTAAQNIQLGPFYLSGDGGDEGIYVESDGKVGIATNNPATQLEVAGTVTATGFVGDGSSLTNVPGDNLGNHTAAQNVQLGSYYLSGDGNNEGVFVDGDGNVGIGTTTPVANLHILGSPTLAKVVIAPNEPSFGDNSQLLLATDHDGSCGVYLEFDGNSNNLGIYGKNYSTVIGPHMTIDRTTGDIGIGTANPYNTLTVDGSADFTGDVLVAGDLGAGTTNPKADLHVVGSPTLGKVIISPDEATGGDDSQLLLSEDNNGNVGMFLEYNGLGDRIELFGKFYSTTYGPHIAVDRTSGNVGIGLGYASTSKKLYVQGDSSDEYIGYFECKDDVNNGYALYATSNGIGGTTHYGVYGHASGASTNYGGYFVGNVQVTGVLTKGGGSFKIDHPSDPENKYLYHSFVESPDMKNIYDGIAVLDSRGEAVVPLPEWFEALNRDFRYQITSIGAPGPNLYIAEEISGNQFKIAGGEAGMKVSWQVTGIRQDAWANANRIPVEEDKPADEQGLYLSPESFGLSETLGIDYVQRMNMEQ